MGLDNGITIEKNRATARLNLNKFYPVVSAGSDTLEICYWRKCWGIRDKIVEYLDYKYNTDYNNYDWLLDAEDISAIIEIIEIFNDKEAWNTNGNSIWGWKEMKKHLTRDIKNLSYLLAKMEDNPNEFDVIFYDSY